MPETRSPLDRNADPTFSWRRRRSRILNQIDPAATAWLLTSTALVLLMTPGLAIFYGGMVRNTGVLNMIMMSFIAIPLVTVSWLLVGYSLAFSGSGADGLIGDLTHVGMLGIGPDTVHGSVPELLFATFQLSFAIITAALVSGAIADRAKFAAWVVFVPVWAVVVYAVVAHWVWAPGGWLLRLGVLDYAGGLVVEIVSGASALALALVLGPRIGFNAGSVLAANGTAAAIFLNTLVAGCLGMLGWLTVEQLRDGKPTTFGAASGVVAGLVAITPSCGTVNTLGATVVGLAAGIVCAFAIGLKFRLGYDDSLDVVGVHFVGGVVGSAGHRCDDRRAARTVLRWRVRTARQTVDGHRGRRRVRVRGVLPAGQTGRPHHRIPHHPGR